MRRAELLLPVRLGQVMTRPTLPARKRALRVFIHGHYNSGNVGDEALLGGLMQALSANLPRVPLEVSFISDRDVTLPDLPDLEARRLTDSLLGELFAVRAADLTIFGGGSQFQDHGTVRRVRFLLKPWLLTRLARRVIGAGLSLGPVSTPAGRWVTRSTLRGMHALHVRDAPSAALARAFGVPVVLGDDLVLSWNPPRDARAKTLADAHWTQAGRAAEAHGTSPCRLLVSFPPLTPVGVEAGEERRLQDAAHQALRRLCTERPHLLVRGMDFEPGSDTASLAAVLGVNSDAPVSSGPVASGPVPSVFQEVGLADVVLATRLHSLVFAFLAERPTLIIVYHPKVRALAEQLRYPERALLSLDDLGRPSVLAERLLDLVDRPEAFLPARSAAEVQAHAHATLDQFLRSACSASVLLPGVTASPPADEVEGERE